MDLPNGLRRARRPRARPGRVKPAARPMPLGSMRRSRWVSLDGSPACSHPPATRKGWVGGELVERRGWISERRFLHALNFCMALPGPEAQQLASYIGYSMYGVRGAITAGGLFVLPSFVLLCVMSAVYASYGEVTTVAGIVRGLGAAVIALVAVAVLRIGRRVIHTPAALLLAAAAFVLIVI